MAPSFGPRAAGRAAESRGPSEREGIGALVSLEPTLSREPSDGPSEREVLARSSIELALADGSGGWSVWGRAGIAGFKGREGDLSLDGDVLSGHIGIDYAWEHLLTGLAVSRNEGEGGFRGLANGAGEVTATLTSVHPYARLSSREGLTVWAIAGFGWGDMELEDKAGRVETDIKMRMAALGGRQELMSLGKAALAAKADAFAMWIESAAVPGLTAVDVNAQRLRLALEGSYDHALASGARLTPTLELGVRHDAGDAETGAGMETGGRLRFSDPSLGLTVEGSGRVLLTHRERGYDDWGVGGALRLSPGAAGRGLSIQLAPSYGQASRGVDRLWTGSAESPAPRAANDNDDRAARLDAEIGYGLGALGGHGLVTPYVGLTLTDGDSRSWCLGSRLALGPGISLSLEVERRESETGPPEQGALLGWRLRLYGLWARPVEPELPSAVRAFQVGTDPGRDPARCNPCHPGLDVTCGSGREARESRDRGHAPFPNHRYSVSRGRRSFEKTRAPEGRYFRCPD